eukprot:scaffold5323_cov173-Amphora_coffeaeformis.AAC.8
MKILNWRPAAAPAASAVSGVVSRYLDGAAGIENDPATPPTTTTTTERGRSLKRKSSRSANRLGLSAFLLIAMSIVCAWMACLVRYVPLIEQLDTATLNSIVAAYPALAGRITSSGNSDTCIITVSAWNNFGYVWNLYDSIQDNSPSIGCFVWFVADATVHPKRTAMRKIDKIMEIAQQFTAVVTLNDLQEYFGKEQFYKRELTFKFDMMELISTIKPFALLYTFEKLGHNNAIFLDSDVWVTDSMDPIQQQLQTHSAIVTPYITAPTPDDRLELFDHQILRMGTYNAGFLAFRNSLASKTFLNWWKDRLRSYGFNDLSRGLYYDQIWLDFITSFMDQKDYLVLRDPRYNIAHWNLHYLGDSLHLDSNTGLPFLDDQPAGFLHFSGSSELRNFDISKISKDTTRYTFSDFPRLEDIWKAYASKLEEHDAGFFRGISYGYEQFKEGRAITPLMRRTYAAATDTAVTAIEASYHLDDAGDRYYGVSIPPIDKIDFQKNVVGDPFCASGHCRSHGKLTFYKWFLTSTPDTYVNSEGCFFFTGLEQRAWQSRPDLQTKFPEPMGKDFIGFKSWFLTHAVRGNHLTLENRNVWRSMWSYHIANHRRFHKIVTGSNDIGINFIGWHGYHFGIAQISRKLYVAGREVNISANAIQLPPPGGGQPSTHPDFLEYELTKSPSEIINLYMVNAEHTTFLKQHIPPMIRENKYNIGIEKSVKPFTFLLVFDFNSYMERKNPFATIRAFLDAFPASSDPTGKYRLVVKSHSGKDADIQEMHATAKNDTRIVFISRMLSDKQNAALHQHQDCFVSLHRSEGYGLNILESLGAGIPVITTNYSGNVEFFRAVPSFLESCAFPVPYELVKIEKTAGPYEAGQHWAEADHEYAVNAMRAVAKNDCKTKHGREISKLVLNQFGQAAIGRQMQSLLNESTERILKKQSEVFAKRLASLEHYSKVLLGHKKRSITS